MVMLVTLQEASDHLRRDTTDDNSDLLIKISAASNAVINYIKDADLAYVGSFNSAGDYIPEIDSAGDLVVKDEIRSAVLIIIGVLYADRQGQQFIDDNSEDRLGKMSLPKAVHWLLDGVGRKPTLA